MDEQPAAKIIAKTLAGEDRQHRAEPDALIKFEHHCRDAERKAKREGQDRYLAVVREQIGRENMEPAFAFARRRLAMADRRLEELDRRARVAPSRHALVDEIEIPFGVARDE